MDCENDTKNIAAINRLEVENYECP